MEQSSSWETNSSSASPRNYAHFTEPKGSLPYSQEPATCSYPEHESQALWSVSWHATFLRSATHPTHGWRTTRCLLSATAYSIHSQLPSIVEAVPPSATLGSPYCGDRDPLITVSAASINYKYLRSVCSGKTVIYLSSLRVILLMLHGISRSAAGYQCQVKVKALLPWDIYVRW
jgi:hypothetical protein